MSRSTQGPDEPESTDEGRGSRRSRRAGRAGGANDFKEMFGEAPANDTPAHGGPDERNEPSAGSAASGRNEPRAGSAASGRNESSAGSGLNEPRAADRYIRGRTRLTVRELMEQMNAEPDAPVRRSPGGVPPAAPQPPGDENPTEVHRFGDLIDIPTENDVTTKFPRITTDVPAEPLQPTPDLSGVPPRSAPRAHPPANRRRNLARSATVGGRILVAIACVTALVGTGFVWGYLKSWNGSWKTINAVNPEDANIRNKGAQYGDENYLIVGTDTRSGENGTVGAGTTADAEGARSDTVILVNIPASRSRVVAVSFPRDLQVDRPECQTWDNSSGTYGDPLPAAQSVKLNSVYADGGPKCLVSVITAMSGLNINHFIAMDFYGFEKVVNTIGGVEVCSTTPLYDYELGQILQRPGHQKLMGRRALNYVRARSIASEGNGDYGRIKRQQLFMSSLLRSTLSGNVLSNPSKLNRIVNTFIQYSYVDGVDTQSLLQLADSMQGIEAGRVTFLTIPTSGTSTDGQNNEIPRTDDINAIFNAIIDDDPLPGEQSKKDTSSSSSTSAKSSGGSSSTSTAPATPTRVSATAQSPGNVGVRVLNGTGRPQVATEVSDKLVPLGFDVRGVADASENRDDTVVRYGPGEQDAAATLAKMFPGSTIQLDHTVKSGVEVIIGTGYGGSIDSVPDAGSTISAEQLPAVVNTSNLPNDLAVTNAGDTTCD